MADAEKKTHVSSAMLSVSDLSSYLYCQRKLWLQKVAGLKEEFPKEAAVLGSIRHDTLEAAYKNEESLLARITKDRVQDIERLYSYFFLSSFSKILTRYREDIRAMSKKASDIYRGMEKAIVSDAVWRSQEIQQFITKHKIYGREILAAMQPQLEMERWVKSDDLGVRGRVDRIEVYDQKSETKNKELIPIELKTGSAPKEGVWEGHQVQIAAYMFMLKQEGHSVKKGKILYLNDQMPEREIFMNPALEQHVRDLTNKVRALLAGPRPDFCKSEKKCAVCGIKDKCYALGR